MTAGTIQTSLYGQRPSIRGGTQGGTGIPAYRNSLNWANADSAIEGTGIRGMLFVLGGN